MGSWIANQWQYNTVKIHSQTGGIGTGFLVAIETQANGSGDVFLVTNKHLIHADHTQLHTVQSINCDIHTQTPPVAPGFQTIPIPLFDANGVSQLFPHQVPHVDVCAIRINGPISAVTNRITSMIDIIRLTTARFRARNEVSWGDEILTICYPDAISQGVNELPLIRQGIISSQIGDPIRCDLPSFTNVVCPAFYIDCAIYGGCSGGVVVLKPAIGRYVENRFDMNPAEPDVLGIVSHSVAIENGTYAGQLAHLGIAWEADTIIDCIVDYYQATRNWDYEDLLRIYFSNRNIVFPGP